MTELNELRAEIADVKSQLFVLMELLPFRQSDINKACAEFNEEPTYVGKSCKHGHNIKYTKNSSCVECSKIRKQAERDMKLSTIPKMSASTAHTMPW